MWGSRSGRPAEGAAPRGDRRKTLAEDGELSAAAAASPWRHRRRPAKVSRAGRRTRRRRL